MNRRLTLWRTSAIAACCVALQLAMTGSAAAQSSIIYHGSAEDYRADFLARARALYADVPDVAGCHPGALAEAEKASFLGALNEIRQLHGLSPVTYDPTYDEQMMQTALIMAANGKVDHNPTEAWACYTPEGAKGAGLSNLSGNLVSSTLELYSGGDELSKWMSEVNNMRSGIGHRKWLLNPAMTSTSFGRVSAAFSRTQLTTAASMRVFDGQALYGYADTSDTPIYPAQIIAYPFGDYPMSYFDNAAGGTILSVALLINSNVRLNGEVDYSQAIIRCSERDGADLPVTDIVYDKQYVGLPMTVEFRVGTLQPDITYDVVLENVLIRGEPTNMNYWFRLKP